jgi:hypothetical protein
MLLCPVADSGMNQDKSRVFRTVHAYICITPMLVRAIQRVTKHTELDIRQQMFLQLVASPTVGIAKAIGVIRVNQGGQMRRSLGSLGSFCGSSEPDVERPAA